MTTDTLHKLGQNFTVNLDTTTHKRLKLQAVEENRRMSEIVRDAVRTYLDLFAEGSAKDAKR